MGGHLTFADGGIDCLFDCHKSFKIMSLSMMHVFRMSDLHMTLYIICSDFFVVRIIEECFIDMCTDVLSDSKMHMCSQVFSYSSRAPARRYIDHQQCYDCE